MGLHRKRETDKGRRAIFDEFEPESDDEEDDEDEDLADGARRLALEGHSEEDEDETTGVMTSQLRHFVIQVS